MIKGKSINELYSKAIERINDDGNVICSDRGDTVEVLHQLFCLEDSHHHWLQNRSNPISIAYSLAELIWVLSGSNDAKVINFWNPALSKYAGATNEYPGAYGYRLFMAFNIDQLKQVYLSLKNNPNGRQNVLLYWHPFEDLPSIQGIPKSLDVPCNICSMLKIRNNSLEWTQIMRSNDIYLGFPYDVALFTNLQEIVSGWLDIKSGIYCHYSDSLHYYKKQSNKLKILDVSNEISNDFFYHSYDFTVECVNKIYGVMKKIAYHDVSKTQLQEYSNYIIGDESFQNLYYVLLTYTAYHFKYTDIEVELLNRCTNDLYKKMWRNWRCK